MIKPEEEFDLWASILVAAIEPHGEYSFLLPDFERLVGEYCDNGILPDPIGEFTHQFAENTLTSTIGLIMALGRLSDEESAADLAVLKRLMRKLVSGFLKGRNNCENALLRIYDRSSNFYTKNSSYWSGNSSSYNSPSYTEMVDEFVKKGPLEEVCAAIHTDPKMELFVFLSRITAALTSVFNVMDSFNVLKRVTAPLTQLLSTYDSKNLRDVDVHALTDVCKFIAHGMMTSLDGEFVDFLLKFGDMCLKSGFLDKQMIGAKLLSSLAVTFQERFKEWAVETELIDYLIKNEVHEKIMPTLSGCVSTVLAASNLSKEALLELYNRTEHAHSSQKQAMNMFLSQALKASEEATISEFLAEITAHSEVTPDLLVFLITFVDQAGYAKASITSHIIKFFLGLVDSDKPVGMVEDAITQLLKITLPKEAQLTMDEYVLDRIPNIPSLGDRYCCFKKLTIEASRLGPDARTEMIDALLEAMTTHPETAMSYLALLKTILVHSQSKLPTTAFPYLIGSQEGWSYFAKLLKKRGLSFVEKESVQSMFEVLGRHDFVHTTPKQLEVIEAVILCNAVEQKKIDNYSVTTVASIDKVKVLDPKVEGLNYMIQMVTFAESEEVSDKALMFLLQLFDGVAVSHYNAFASAHVEELINMDISDQRLCYRNLKMVNAFVERFEKTFDMAQFGMQRHKLLHKNDITVHVQIGEQTIDVRCRPSIPGSQLSQMVAFKMRKQKDYLYLKNNGNYVSYCDPIGAHGVKDGTTLVLSDNTELKSDANFPETCMTMIFAKERVVEKVYSLIQREDLLPELKRAAWRFLMLMPTASSVSYMDQTQFVSALGSSRTEIQLRYLLQCAEYQHMEGVHPVVLEMLSNGQISKFSLYDALMIVKSNMQLSSNATAAKFCEFLVKTLADKEADKLKEIIVELLISIVTQFAEEVATCFICNPDRFQTIILTLDPHLLAQLSQVFGFFEKQKNQAFNILVSFIDSVKGDKSRICEYFQLVSAVFDDSSDVEASIRFSVALMDKPGSPLFESICRFLHTVLSKQPESCKNHLDIFETALESLFQSSQTTTQEALFALMELFCTQDENCRKRFRETTLQGLSIETDRWGYDPATNTKSSSGFTGLRNLGATCYMNSVFQQLFHNLAFRNSIFTSGPEKDWQIEFRSVFVRLLLTSLPFVNTQPFTSTWKFYGDEVVNPRMQQDAVEFMQLLLDRLGDTYYKGELSNIMVGVVESDGFRQSRPEEFWGLPLVVKECKSFEESLDSFLQKETVTGYQAESLGKKIDIVKFSRVNKAPDYLVLQLKRFEYDLTTWARIKVNDKFEFPKEFDLEKLMEAEGTHVRYTLTGIIVHNGTAEGGHYTSYIKIGDKWLLFNDTSVTESSETTVNADSFGGKQSTATDYEEHLPSAYMLFYAKTELLSVPQKEFDQSYFEVNDPELMAEIRKENAEYLRMQSVFGTALMNLMLKSDDLELLVTYAFSIFAHSHHTATAADFAKHVVEIMEKGQAEDWVIDLCLAQVERIEDIFVHCTTTDVCKAVVSILSHVIEKADKAKGGQFAMNLFDELQTPAVMQTWRVIPNFLELIICFCTHNLDFVKENQWTQRLIKFVKAALESTKSIVYLQNINFSAVFMFFNENIGLLSTDDLREVCSLASTVLQSTVHSDLFVQLVRNCAEKGIIDMTEFIDALLATIKDPSSPYVVSLFVQLGTTEETAMKFLNAPRVSKEALVTTISNEIYAAHEPEISKRLLASPRILFYLISCDSSKAISKMEQIYLALFKNVHALNAFTRAENGLTQKTIEFTWKDSANALFATGDDIPRMLNALAAVIDGIEEINSNPSAWLSCKIANRRFTHLIRVMYWMILRSRAELTDKQTLTILDMFDTFRKAEIVNDCNMVELVRVIGVLPGCSTKFIIERFDHLADLIFGGKYEGTQILEEWIFVVFFDSFDHIFANHPELLIRLLASPVFQNAFAVATRSISSEQFDIFSSVIDRAEVSIKDLLLQNFDSLLMNHGMAGLGMIERCSDYPMNDDTYNTLISTVFQECTKTAATTAEQLRIANAHSYMKQLSESYNLVSAAPICSCMYDVLKNISSPKGPSFMESLIGMVMLACTKSEDAKKAAFEGIDKIEEEAKQPNWTLESVRCRIKMLDEKSVESHVAIAAEAAARYVTASLADRSGDQYICKLFIELIKQEGMAAHSTWAIDTLRAISKHSVPTPETLELLKTSVTELTDEQLTTAVKEVAETCDSSALTSVLNSCNTFIEQRPKIREQILEAAGLVGEQYDNLKTSHGTSYTHVFTRQA